MRKPELIVRRPLLTEKGNRLKESGGRSETDGMEAGDVKAKVLFEVARDANKAEVKFAVEHLWNVSVLSVRTAVVRGKEKRVGRFIGRRSNWKKAIVTLAAGQNIEFFEGV